MTEIPRRNRIDKFTPAERAIYDAVQAVEAMAADVRLTDAVILLQAARDSVADYIDNIWPSRRYVSALPASASPHPENPCVFRSIEGVASCGTHWTALEDGDKSWRCPVSGATFPWGTAFGTAAISEAGVTDV